MEELAWGQMAGLATESVPFLSFKNFFVLIS